MRFIYKQYKKLTRFRWWLLYLFVPVVLAKRRYACVVPRLRRAFGKRPLKVGFVVGNAAKWKAQSLYDLMIKSELYSPSIVLTICDAENALGADEKEKHLERMARYFESKGMESVVAYSAEKESCIDINDFGFDLVFYHQPWGVCPNQEPCCAAKRALTIYIPYYVPNYGSFKMECEPPFMRTLLWFCTLSEGWASDYTNHLKGAPCACTFLPVGHTALDYFTLNRVRENAECVIYAPHWSIDCAGNENDENFSTFLWSGIPILEYAKAHPDVKWVFKPHPTLRQVLVKSGVWTQEQTDQYYADWESIASSCYDSDYQEIFNNSYAMITDCGSFLTEFACTGRPIIHLISSTCKIVPFPVSRRLFDTYYQVRDLKQMYEVFESIIIRKEDGKKDERLAMAKAAGLFGNYSAQKILDRLESTLGREVHDNKLSLP